MTKNDAIGNRCPCCGKENNKNNLKKCRRADYCFYSEHYPFPICLTGNGENDWKGDIIKTTEKALKLRGWGVCLNYSINANKFLDIKFKRNNKKLRESCRY